MGDALQHLLRWRKRVFGCWRFSGAIFRRNTTDQARVDETPTTTAKIDSLTIIQPTCWKSVLIDIFHIKIFMVHSEHVILRKISSGFEVIYRLYRCIRHAPHLVATSQDSESSRGRRNWVQRYPHGTDICATILVPWYSAVDPWSTNWRVFLVVPATGATCRPEAQIGWRTGVQHQRKNMPHKQTRQQHH